jgi:hypothetical protein
VGIMTRGSNSAGKKVVAYLVPRARTFLVHPEAQVAFELLRDFLPRGEGLTRTAGRPILEVLDTDEGPDGALMVVGRFKEFLQLGNGLTDDVLVIPRTGTPEQIRDDAWAEVCAELLVPSASLRDLTRLYRRLRQTIPPASCAPIFGGRRLTQKAFAAQVAIHSRTLARSLKKNPAHPVGVQTIFQEALNETAR